MFSLSSSCCLQKISAFVLKANNVGHAMAAAEAVKEIAESLMAAAGWLELEFQLLPDIRSQDEKDVEDQYDDTDIEKP